MSKKKDIIRVGDRVKVTNPAWIERWGYENNLAQVSEEVADKYRSQISELLRTIRSLEGCKDSFKDSFKGIEHKDISRVASAVAYHLVGVRMKGGAERKLFYLKPTPKPTGLQLLPSSNYTFPHGNEVREIKIVKTGKYYSPTGGYDSWTGECGYESGGLDSQKTHKLLRLECCESWIEVINVEKVNEDK